MFCNQCKTLLEETYLQSFWKISDSMLVRLAKKQFPLNTIYTFIFSKRDYKELLDEIFVISRIIKVEVGVISRNRRLRLITLTETLIILDITKTESNNGFIAHCRNETKKVMLLLLHWQQARQSERTWHDYPQKSCTAVIHDMIIRDLECRWCDYCIICSYDVRSTDFENWLLAFSQSGRRLWIQCIIITIIVILPV